MIFQDEFFFLSLGNKKYKYDDHGRKMGFYIMTTKGTKLEQGSIRSSPRHIDPVV